MRNRFLLLAVALLSLAPAALFAQSFDATKPANSSAMVAAEIRTNFTALERRLYTTTVATGNNLAVETTLAQYTVPAATLATDGQYLRVQASGYLAANGATKTAKLYFGGTSVGSSSAASGSRWNLKALIIRKGATSQVIAGFEVQYQAASPGLGGTGAQPTPAATLASPVVVKVTGQGSASSDIVLESMTVELVPN
jgi:hypothetical protein